MAIVSTLWSLALLGAIALSLSFTGNISYRLAQNSFQVAHDVALTDAAVNRAVLALLDPRPDKRWPLNAAGKRFDFGGASLRIRIQDEMGKIDLNQTDGSTLTQLFQSAGLDAMATGALVDKVLDWRDSNPLKRTNGAKADEYRAAGYDYGPRNGPFQSVDELTLVMGMTHDLYKRVEPALTVYSGRQFVDPQFAAPEVLSALPALAAAYPIAAAQSQQLAGAMPFGSFGDSMTALKGRAFTIDAEIERPTRIARLHSAVRLIGNPTEPFWMLNWQRP
jgi:general secretion pathway protein K